MTNAYLALCFFACVNYLLIRFSGSEMYFFRMFDSVFFISDSLLISAILVLGDYKRDEKLKLVSPGKAIVEDLTVSGEDLYGRMPYVREVAQAIEATANKAALGIAVNGVWGAGKTFFLNQLRTELAKNPVNVIFEIQPWLGEKFRSPTQELFDTLEQKIFEFNPHASLYLDRYVRKMSTSAEGDTFLIGAVKNLFGSLLADKTLESQKQRISCEISSTGKRFVVIIDDVDRLDVEEISEVMRLVRNTANFSNMVFIVAFDRKYVLSALEADNKAFDKSRYLEKIFQLDVFLPPIRENVAKTALLNYFDQLVSETGEESPRIREAVSLLSSSQFLIDYNPHVRGKINVIEKYLVTIRDVTRFFNGFKIVYNLINPEIELVDFMLLELIKFRSTEIYQLVANLEIANADFINYYIEFDEQKYNALFVSDTHPSLSKMSYKDRQVLQDSLKYLFPPREVILHNSNTGQPRKLPDQSVTYLKNFKLYFQYTTFDGFSITQYLAARESDDSGLLNYIELVCSAMSTESRDEFCDAFTRYSLENMFTNWEIFSKTFYSTVYLMKYGKDFKFDSVFNAILQFERISPIVNGGKLFYLLDSISSIFFSDQIDLMSKIKFSELSLGSFRYGSDRIFDEIPLVDAFLEHHDFCGLDYIIKNTENQAAIYNIVLISVHYRSGTATDFGLLDAYKTYLREYGLYFMSQMLYSADAKFSTVRRYALSTLVHRVFPSESEIRNFLILYPKNACSMFILSNLEKLQIAGQAGVEFDTKFVDGLLDECFHAGSTTS
jgi:hypothetical protein